MKGVRKSSAQLDVEGTAIVFSSAPMVKIPADLPERLALAVCDVCGAAPQVERHAAAGDLVVVFGGGGKSGLLCCVEARRKVGTERHGDRRGIGRTLRGRSRALGVCDAVIRADARDPLATRAAVLPATRDREADLVVSCVNVTGVEPAAILLTRRGARSISSR